MSLKHTLTRLGTGVAVATALTVATSTATATERVRWQVPLAFPSHLVGLTTPVKHLSENLRTISGGNIELRYYEPGELVPPVRDHAGRQRSSLPLYLQ